MIKTVEKTIENKEVVDYKGSRRLAVAPMLDYAYI